MRPCQGRDRGPIPLTRSKINPRCNRGFFFDWESDPSSIPFRKAVPSLSRDAGNRRCPEWGSGCCVVVRQAFGSSDQKRSEIPLTRSTRKTYLYRATSPTLLVYV